MNIDHLVQMANQIATFFESQSDADQAAVETAAHLRKFWDPRMRRQIIAHVQGADGTHLAAVAHAAVLRLAQESAAAATA